MSKVRTPKFRASFPKLFKPELNDQSGKMEYSVTCIFPKGEDLTALKNACNEVIAAKFGPDKTKWPKDLKSPFKDQGTRVQKTKDTKEVITDPKTGKPLLHAGFEEGATFITVKSYQQPGVVDQNVQKIMDEKEIYSGCYMWATITAQYYDKRGNRGVSFWINNAQKLADGEPLGSRVSAEAEFAPVAGGSSSSEASSGAGMWD